MSIFTTNQLMSYSEIITVYCKNHKYMYVYHVRKRRVFWCYNTTYTDSCALQRHLLSYETPTCKTESTKLATFRNTKKHENYDQCTKLSNQHTSIMFSLIHVLSLASRSETSHPAVLQQVTEMPVFWKHFDLIVPVAQNYENFLYLFFSSWWSVSELLWNVSTIILLVYCRML